MAIDKGEKHSYKIKNTDRTVGAILSNEISKKYSAKVLPKNTLKLNFEGSAGQSLGHFQQSLKMVIDGNTNDYFGKGLSGATIIVRKPKKAQIYENIITGNVTIWRHIRWSLHKWNCRRKILCPKFRCICSCWRYWWPWLWIHDRWCRFNIRWNRAKFRSWYSGGIAYIYNSKMIWLQKLQYGIHWAWKTESTGFRYYQNWFKIILHTNSEIAKQILSNWELSKRKFIKVMPIEYKRALEKLAEEKINQIIN